MSHELELARLRRSEQERRIETSRETHSKTVLARVISTSPNLAVGKFLKAIPQAVLGAETEGAVASFADLGTTPILVDPVGPGVPATTDRIIAHHVPFRWIQHRRSATSGGIGTLLGCACAHPPATLTMTVGPTSPAANGLLNSCTLTYRTTPSELGPLHLGTSAYLSTALFADPQTGDPFYYYLGCFSSLIRISRVFPYSVYGSPFLDSVIFFWTIGLHGNTCSPFLLSNGQIFFGGDPTVTVTISG